MQEQNDWDSMCEEISNRIEAVEATSSCMETELVDLKNFIILNDSYFFKGSLNCSLTIRAMHGDTIQVISYYGERMGTFTSIADLAKFLQSLMNGEFA